MIKPEIVKPCPENWENMKIGLHNRHCNNCRKDVINFTGKDRKEILEFLLSNYGTKICGRFNPSQLDYSHTDILMTISELSKKSKNSNLAFYLLTISALTLASCNDNSTIKSNVEATDSIGKVKNESNTLPNKNLPNKIDTSIVTVERAIIGDVEVVDNNKSSDSIRVFAEKMPEFNGGVDFLMNFLKQHVIYPKLERLNKIEGIVYVNFVVTKTGKITNPQILKGLGENFDKEVIRVINLMPDWIPGEEDKQKVDVKFCMPIKFKL